MFRYLPILITLLATLVNGYALYETGVTIWAQTQLSRHGRLTQATVVGLVERTFEDGRDYTLRLRFVTAAGAVVGAGSRQGYDSLAYRVGQSVALRYLPRDPTLCLTEAERTNWWSLPQLVLFICLVPFNWWMSRQAYEVAHQP